MPTTPSPERRRAAAIAGHVGDVATAAAALADPQADVRIAGLRSLARLEELDEHALVRALADPAPEVRIAALELAARQAEPDLRAGLDDAEPMVVEAAAWALGERSDLGAVARLSEIATSHDEPLAREAAVAALGAIGDPSGLSAILAATRDKPAIRRRAIVCLAPFEGPEVDAAFARARSDRDRQVRDAVDELLGPEED